ncbi:hypothetical protein BV898_08439 [Hypsibius exemplaris]|uniref:G-protein coupled receptors family 1 profile domain-containing protein n=1 Tax=Hypsibius exemplaris TaxID=2072580 RepID=A0A1W0WQM3_HYPEX|nr:hypothetical protein BV898_08439 [Hypsibius exemplaris]
MNHSLPAPNIENPSIWPNSSTNPSPDDHHSRQLIWPNSSTNPPPDDHSRQLICWITAVLATNVFGTVANAILLLVLTAHRPLRQSASCALIVHCIIIDLYSTAVVVPVLTVPVYLGPAFPLPRDFCRFQPLIIYSSYAASMYASCVLALHRLLATLIPHRFHVLTGRRPLTAMIIFPWVVALAINIFPTVETGIRTVRSPLSGGCTFTAVEGWSNQQVFLLLSTLGYYLPTGLMGVSYTVILVKSCRDLRRRKRKSRALLRRIDISRTLCLSFFWHCFTIYPGIIALAFFAQEYAGSFTGQLWIKWLGSSFSAINPIFLCCSSSLFQQGIKAVLRKMFRCQRANGEGGFMGVPETLEGSSTLIRGDFGEDDVEMVAISKY